MKVILASKKHLVPAAKILVEAYYPSMADATKWLIQRIKRKEVFVALENDVVGVLVYTRDFSHGLNYIEDIAVSKKFRRKGIAMQLIRKFIQISRKETPKNQKFALSSTNTTNKASFRMHAKAGFKKIGRLKGIHYGKDEVYFAYKLR